MNSKISLFIIEDDPKLRQMLSEYFTLNDFSVTCFKDSEGVVTSVIAQQPDLIILDLMLPGDDGLTICRRIRCEYSGKLLMLTASGDDFDHVAALEVGADDFVTKPIKPRVLLARIRMLLRRQSNCSEKEQSHKSKSITFGQLTLQLQPKSCQLAGTAITMTDSEFDLLWTLASHPNEVLSREELTRVLRRIEYDGLDRTVDNKIVNLRKKLSDSSSTPKRILTVRGKGYLFIPDSW